MLARHINNYLCTICEKTNVDDFGDMCYPCYKFMRRKNSIPSFDVWWKQENEKVMGDGFVPEIFKQLAKGGWDAAIAAVQNDEGYDPPKINSPKDASKSIATRVLYNLLYSLIGNIMDYAPEGRSHGYPDDNHFYTDKDKVSYVEVIYNRSGFIGKKEWKISDDPFIANLIDIINMVSTGKVRSKENE